MTSTTDSQGSAPAFSLGLGPGWVLQLAIRAILAER
jgi:hypothetical protein